jgi:GDP-D-mannose dehydratase
MSIPKSAVATGATGRDDACLARLMLAKARGTDGRAGSVNLPRVQELGIQAHATFVK